MRIYLGGGIAGLTDSECNDWRSYMKEKFEQYEAITCVDPMRRDYRGVEMTAEVVKEIVDGDLADIRSCEVLIAMMPKPSWGTGMETFWAYQQGVFVIAIVPEGTHVSPWVAYHSCRVVATLDEAVKAAIEFGVDGHYLPHRRIQ